MDFSLFVASHFQAKDDFIFYMTVYLIFIKIKLYKRQVIKELNKNYIDLSL